MQLCIVACVRQADLQPLVLYIAITLGPTTRPPHHQQGCHVTKPPTPVPQPSPMVPAHL